MSRKKIFFILIGGFIALLLMNTNIEVTAQDPDECQAGQYSNESTGYLCVDADPGHYVPEANATAQIACLPGTYQPAAGATSCLIAGPGHFVDVAAAVAQTACAPGFYQPNSGAVNCIAADPGYFVDMTASVAQTACAPGFYQPYSGAISCLAADPGYFVDTAASVAQTACAAGTYQPNSGAVNCIPADPGYFIDMTASVAQIACAPGFYQPYSGAISCLAADPGFYVPDSAATEQLACPAGTTSGAAATECTPDGYTFTGFFAPVDMAALNMVKAGRAIPIKFSLGGDQGLDIMAAGYPASVSVTCDNNAPLDTIEETVTAGSSSLSYDAATDEYTYVWKTNKSWANSCRTLTVMLDDGSVHQASFKFNK